MVHYSLIVLLVIAVLPAIRSNPIANGQRVSAVDSPWHVEINLRNASAYICGGTLVTTKRVLTTAHCKVSDELFVYVGTQYTGSREAEDTVNIEHFYVHPNYTHNVITFDIGMAVLERRVNKSDRVQTIPYNFDYRVPQFGDRFEVVGNGLTVSDEDVFTAPSLFRLKGHGKIVYCNDSRLEVTNQMQAYIVCAKFEDRTGTCLGDNGGGYVVTGGDRPLLIAIDVVGSRCGSQNPVGFAINVASFHRWIQSVP